MMYTVNVENGKGQVLEQIKINAEYCVLDYVKDCLHNGLWNNVESFEGVYSDIAGMAFTDPEDGYTLDWLTSNEIAEIEEEYNAMKMQF